MRNTTERLRDIQEAIANIQKYTDQGRKAFDENELIQTWVIRHLEIIGEAVSAIPQDFRKRYPEVPWKQANGVRNILIHLYFKVDHDTIWAIVEHDLPSLKTNIDAILTNEE